MGIRLSDLPPELQKQVLLMTGAPAPKVRRPRVMKLKSRLMKRCACGFEIFRPDGIYPEECDSCGNPWPTGT